MYPVYYISNYLGILEKATTLVKVRNSFGTWSANILGGQDRHVYEPVRCKRPQTSVSSISTAALLDNQFIFFTFHSP